MTTGLVREKRETGGCAACFPP